MLKLTLFFTTISITCLIITDALILCAFGMSTGFTDGLIDVLTILTEGR